MSHLKIQNITVPNLSQKTKGKLNDLLFVIDSVGGWATFLSVIKNCFATAKIIFERMAI
jgi:hypothetical protein